MKWASQARSRTGSSSWMAALSSRTPPSPRWPPTRPARRSRVLSATQNTDLTQHIPKGQAMLIDALQCGEFDRDVLQMLQAGGYTCVTPTLGFWEGTLESMDAIGTWKDMERDNSDLI